MTWFALFVTLYVAIALFAALMTLAEGSGRPAKTLQNRILGCLACCFWPLALLAVAVARYMTPVTSQAPAKTGTRA